MPYIDIKISKPSNRELLESTNIITIKKTETNTSFLDLNFVIFKLKYILLQHLLKTY
jgi:hypothetical protein